MRAPKKNIYKKLGDIRPLESPPEDFPFFPGANFKTIPVKTESSVKNVEIETVSFSPLEIKQVSFNNPVSKLDSKIKIDSRRKRFFLPFIIGAILSSLAFYSFLVLNFKEDAISSSKSIAEKFIETAGYFKNFDFKSGNKSLFSAKSEIKELRFQAENLGLAQIAGLLGGFFDSFKKASDSLSGLENTASLALETGENLDVLKSDGLSWFLNGEGDKLLPLLKEVESDSRLIMKEGDNLSSALSLVSQDSESIGSFLSFRNDLDGLNDFLSSLISFIDYPLERHWLIVFQNPSELRPAGGFIGSYADLSVSRGAVKELKVSDIYDPDGQLDLNIVPPAPLQTIVSRWTARDSNWFFDFKKSAEKITFLLNSSKIYSEKGITFDGVLAVNTDVFESILEAVGPVELPEYDLTLSKDNFLEEIQYEIEVKRTKDKGQPKTVIKDATPIILSKINELPLEKKNALIEKIIYHFGQKDLMLYSSDKNLQAFFEKKKVAGRVFETSPAFQGNYLAVVAANIAGGKTDAFLNQDIYLKTEINTEGRITNFLSIERSHNGRDAKYDWYTTKNQSFIRVLAPSGSKLLNLTGATNKKIYPPLDYEKEEFQKDEDIVLLEKGEEAGKSVFSAWLTTLAGQTKTLRFEYENEKKMIVSEGQKFSFVFDRQSGVKGGVKFDIEAPPGFKWAEADNFLFTFENPAPEKRIEFVLTLKSV
ncbi:MAG: DUF4012 domain-containing protein [Candidatus Paceibacterota bacterium]